MTETATRTFALSAAAYRYASGAVVAEIGCVEITRADGADLRLPQWRVEFPVELVPALLEQLTAIAAADAVARAEAT